MTTQKVLDEAKKYFDNDHIYVIEYRRDQKAYLDQMEKVLGVKDKITQQIIDMSQAKNDDAPNFSKIYTFSYFQILHEFKSTQ